MKKSRLLRWLLHEITFQSRFIGLRDRLRCPRCHAVGTWKPHGGFFAVGDLRPVRRWLCKFCGHYRGPEGELTCRPSSVRKCWILPDEDGYGEPTPLERLGTEVWPWRG